MQRSAIQLLSLAAAALLAAPFSHAKEPANTPSEKPQLAYEVSEGRNLNALLREGPVAAHLVLRSGLDPRALVAFPAGNSGVGVWFDRLESPAEWEILTPPKAVNAPDAKGRKLHGITTKIALNAPALTIKGASLSSVRVLRDYELTGTQPDDVRVAARFAPGQIIWERARLDGAPGYKLMLELDEGRIAGERIIAGPDGRISFRLTALSGEPPLTPLAGAALLNARAASDPAARKTLEFLSYKEKFLAGSWRFNTYFGRDTLMSLRLLMPALTPQAAEAGLGSVLARLSDDGEVAHEEDIGEFAILRNKERDGSLSDAPLYDYKMIDETPMLAPVAAHWLLDDPRGAPRAKAFLAASSGPAESNGAALTANLLNIVDSAAPFAADPRPENLVALRQGITVGNWRDSQEGLAWGRYPYDVNAVLIPAGLEAAARLEASGLLDPWLDDEARNKLRRAGAMAQIWQNRAPPLFTATIPHEAARQAVSRAAAKAGLAPDPALAALAGETLRFPALVLDAAGKPMPIVHSDAGYALLFGNPKPHELELMVAAMMRPFPAGLMSEAGLFVANPSFASKEAQSLLTPTAYHGETVWSWQHAVLLAGLDRQLARTDLPTASRAQLMAARKKTAEVVKETGKWRNSELWSWRVEDGKIVPSAFGASDQDADESNAAQLWSTVFLGLPR